MIESIHRTLPNIPSPRSPRLVTPEEKGYVTPQPWQCKPFVDAQTAGIELRWTTACTMTVTNVDGKAVFDFDGEPQPVQQISPDHYGVCTGHQIVLPRGFNGLILPHPRFYDRVPDGAYNDMPAIIPGVLEMDWWPAMFHVVAAMPPAGVEHIFHAGEPYCQIIPVLRTEISIRRMDDDEQSAWEERDEFISDRRLSIATHTWEAGGRIFANTYKVLAKEIKKLGWAGVREKYPNPDQPESGIEKTRRLC